MQTIKFQNMREKRQELFNVDNYTFNKFMFDSGERNVYSNVNLSIFVDDYCNADCDFCVAQLRFENRGQMYKKSKIDSLEEYMVRLDQVFKRIRPLNPSISITGGEPTWSDKLPFILDLINEYGFRKRTLTTNGSGPVSYTHLDVYKRQGQENFTIDPSQLTEENYLQLLHANVYSVSKPKAQGSEHIESSIPSIRCV